MLDCRCRATSSNADRFSVVSLNGVFPAMHLRSGHVATRFPWAVAFVVSLPANLWAGMPTVTLSDVARMRLSTISFFCLGFLLAAQVTRWAWNRLATEILWLPKLSYRLALVLVGAWGMAFVLVLTMISGARELMTPAAWERSGATYRLADGRAPAAVADAANATEMAAKRSRHDSTGMTGERQSKLDRLGKELEQSAAANNGRFPGSFVEAGISDDLAGLPSVPKMNYVYPAAGRIWRQGILVVYEPNVFGDEVWAYLAGGMTARMTIDDLQDLLEGPVGE